MIDLYYVILRKRPEFATSTADDRAFSLRRHELQESNIYRSGMNNAVRPSASATKTRTSPAPWRAVIPGNCAAIRVNCASERCFIPKFVRILTKLGKTIVQYPKEFGLSAMEALLNGITLGVEAGDITTQSVDALVISATRDFNPDSSTEMGRRVLTAAGPVLRAQMSILPQAEIGDTIMTVAGNLPTRHLIHAVCPTMGSGGERGQLARTVWNVLRLAVEKKLRSIAFTPLAIERFGFPIEGCASIMAQKIVDFTFEETAPLVSIRICLDSPQTALFFDRALLREIEIAQREAGIGN